MNNKENPLSTCSSCGFSSFCHLEQANPKWVYQINSAVKKQLLLKKKQPLYVPQNTFHSLYAIKSGCLKTYEIDRDGNELINGFYFPGEILGFEAIARGSYLFSAAVLSEALVCEIPYTHFIELLNSNLSLQKQVLYLMSQKLTAGTYLNFVTAEQRLAAFLIDLSKRLFVSEQPLEFSLPMSRQDIGNYLRLTAETISRLFSQFKASKIISIEHRKVKFLQHGHLEMLAGNVR